MYAKIKAEIEGDPLGLGYEGESHVNIAALMNSDITSLSPTKVTANALMKALGADAGAAILDKLEVAAADSPAVKWALRSITSVGIDVATESARVTIGELAPAVLTAAEAAAIKQMAEITTTRATQLGATNISEQMVKNALDGGY